MKNFEGRLLADMSDLPIDSVLRGYHLLAMGLSSRQTVQVGKQFFLLVRQVSRLTRYLGEVLLQKKVGIVPLEMNQVTESLRQVDHLPLLAYSLPVYMLLVIWDQDSLGP